MVVCGRRLGFFRGGGRVCVMKVLSVHEAQTFSLLAAGLLAACFRGGGVMVCWSILLVPAVVCMLMGYCTDIRY